MPSPPDVSDPAVRATIARNVVHSCLGILSDMPLDEMLCVVMDDGDRLARVVGEHVARAAGEPWTPEPSIHARPAPRALVLEVREALGDRLVQRLVRPLAPSTMRVLWLTPHQRHVIDVAIDPHVLASAKDQLQEARLDAELGDEAVALLPEMRAREVAGTWRDPMRYVPMPMPPDWSLGGVDDIGVLSVAIGDRLHAQIAAIDTADVGKLLFVNLRRLLGGDDVTDAEAQQVLDRVRNVRGGFRPLEGAEAILGPGRLFASRVANRDSLLGSG